ncbi:MAG: ABC transporter permease [Tenacibaculum sp.]|nr:ABC transporter permease [Tenacibaculum sp.]
MNFSFYIAKRYLFSKTSTNAVNIITLIAMFGVIIGSLALFIILSGFSGLRTFSYSLLETSSPDLKITAKKGKSFVFTSNIKEVLQNNSDIKLYSPTVEERVFLQYKDRNHIANIKGVGSNYNKITDIDSSLVMGEWINKDYLNTAVIGGGISYKLSLGILNFGGQLEILVPKAGKGFINPNNAFSSVKTQIVGVYEGTEEFQNKYVFTNISLAQELLSYKENQISAIEIKLINNELSNNVKSKLQEELGSNYRVETREQLNSLFYKVINTENFISYLIFTLIVIIALFNVIGAIIMMIIDKKENLKTLFNLGTGITEIKKIFVFQGFLLTLVGMVIGLFIGIILVLVQQKYSLFMIAQNIPYPVEFRWMNLFTVIITISVLGFIASKIASSRINTNFIK